ncbi:MAG: hypothetical protein AAB759_00505 [Patescibacteria group bacterium]
MTRLALFLLVLVVPGIGAAVGGTKDGGEGMVPGQYAANPLDFISDVYRFGLALGGLLAFAMIIYGAVQYTVAAGNSSVQSDAKDRITQALIGLVLLLSVVLILNTISPAILLTKLPTMDTFDPIRESSNTTYVLCGGVICPPTETCFYGAGEPACKPIGTCGGGLVCPKPETCGLTSRGTPVCIPPLPRR